MDFAGSFSRINKGHDYLFVVVKIFRKMCTLGPCKKTIKGQDETNMFLKRSRCALGEQGTSFDIDILGFSMPFGLQFGIIWTPS